MENNLAAIDMIHGMGLFGACIATPTAEAAHDLATRDVGDYAAQRLLDLDFPANKRANCLASATCRWRKPRG